MSSVFYLGDAGGIYPKLPSKDFPFFSIFDSLSYVLNRAFRKFGSVMCFSFRNSPFRGCVRYVFESCTKPKVFGVRANSIVTLMQNAHSFWDRPFMYFPRKTVDCYIPVSRTKESVSVISRCCIPRPATFFFNNIVEIPFYWVNWPSSIKHWFYFHWNII